MAGSLHADTRKYELRLLGSLPSMEGGRSRAFAINNAGEIVGEAEFDTNLDGQIDSFDLGLLLSNWECTCDEPCEGGGESAMVASEEAGDLAGEALAQLGFASVGAFNEWRASASPEAEAGALESLWAILSSELGL